MKKNLIVISLSFLMLSCTSVEVSSVKNVEEIPHVCIRKNSKVMVSDFIEVLEKGLEKHAITSEVYSRKMPRHCEYKLYYTARRSWDFAPYLSVAELELYRAHRKIGSAKYRLRNRGGLSLMKWMGTESKIMPVIDELLSGGDNENQ